MLTSLLKGLALTALALFVCPLGAGIIQYPPEAHATETTVTVRVVWLASYAEVNRVCHMIDKSRPDPDATTSILACFWNNTIYAVQPANFNDEFNLMILGHEFWHALGAEHP